MNTWQRVAMIYGASLAGAALISYLRGKRTVGEIAWDTALWGGAAGTGINVLAAVVLAPDGTILAVARKNTASGVGKLSKEAVQLLSNIDAEKLYANMKANGVTVAPVPDDPNIVMQDPE